MHFALLASRVMLSLMLLLWLWQTSDRRRHLTQMFSCLSKTEAACAPAFVLVWGLPTLAQELSKKTPTNAIKQGLVLVVCLFMGLTCLLC